MLLTLLNSNKEKIAFLSNITECNLTQQINTIDRLEFTIPYADKNAQLILEEMYVQTENDMYVIKALEINTKEIRCECRQDTELLSSKLHNNGFTSLTANISDTLNLAFLQTGYVVHTMGILTKKRTLKLASTNALDILFTAVKKFGFEFRINSLTKVVTIAEEFGVDKGTYFSDQLNAEEINLSTDTLDFATRLYCRGKDGLTFSDINGGKDYVENFTFSTKIVNKYWEDNRYTVKEDLLEDATKKLENLCKPSKSYSVSILDLASLKAEYNYLSFNLGDSITLINSKNKYRDKQRIVEINRDLINVHNINVTLANNLLSFEQLQERNEETSEVVEEIVNEDNTISGEVLEDKTVTNNKLAVNSITAENIKANSITSDKILAGAITSAKIEAGAITAGSSIIAEGAIGDAQISKLSATKLSAGIIDASYIEVKNLNAENITVGSINGERIGNGAIDNSKVADNANISGSKLNINDVIVSINNADTQINGTKINVGDRTLDAELSTQKILINGNTETMSKQASSINALDNAIKLKVDNQTYTSDVEGINTKLNKNTSNIDLMQNAISLKVSQTDVENTISNIKLGGTNLYPRPTEELVSTRFLPIATAEIFKNHVGKSITISFDMKCEIARPITIYPYQDNGISIEGFTRVKVVEVNKYERFTFNTTIKDWGINDETFTKGSIAFYETIDTQNFSVKNIEFVVDKVPFTEKITQIDTQVAEVNVNLDGITQRVSGTETKTTELGIGLHDTMTRVSSAEQKITPTSIMNTINTSINDGTGAIDTVYTKLDKDGFTIKNGALKIKNKADKTVLEGDINGNLVINGEFKNKGGANGYDSIAIKDNSLKIYDWQHNGVEIGNISAVNSYWNETVSGMALSVPKASFLDIVQDGRSVITFDLRKVLGKYTNAPVTIRGDIDLGTYKLQFGNSNQANISTSGGGSLVMSVPANVVRRGFRVETITGAPVFGYFAGDTYPVQSNYPFSVNGNFTVSGSKNSLQATKNYGDRLINAYETAEYYFGDIGQGIINSQGECLIHIDEILQECINTKCAYQVFTQVYNGKITTLERQENYFIVKGEPNTKFGYELKAKRKGYENHRLEKPEIGTIEDKAYFADDELKNNTSEETLDNILDFNLESILL